MLAQALFIIGAVEQATNARPWMNRNDPAEVRAQKLVDQMTLEEKVALFGGEDCGEDVPCCQGKGDFPGYTGNICSNTRLGIPAIKANARVSCPPGEYGMALQPRYRCNV